MDPVLASIARRIGGTPGQVIFKWAHAKGFVVVTTTSRLTRLHEYLDVVHLRASPSPLHSLVIISIPIFSGPHARRNRSYRRGRCERPSSSHAFMAPKTFVCSLGTRPCGTRCACDTVCDHVLVLSWMARVSVMTQTFLGLIAICADLAVSSKLNVLYLGGIQYLGENPTHRGDQTPA